MRIKSVAMFVVVVAVFLAALATTPAPCQPPGEKASGGKIYLPIYHSVFIGQTLKDYHLTVTMTVRNLDPARPITVLSIKSYDQQGNYKGDLLKEAVVLAPMATGRWLLPKDKDRKEDIGGASLVVQWQASDGARLPLVQAMMVGTRSTLGLSYMTTGIPLK